MTRSLSITILGLTTLLAGSSAWAVKIADITRLSGQRPNVLVGLGLVTGLNGTGDGGNFNGAMKPLRDMLAQFADPLTLQELANVQNVAIVSITVVLPETGVHSGDKVDVQVTGLASKSLKGGRLFITPLKVAKRDTAPGMAFAQGPVTILDPTSPNTGVVKGGAVMEFDLQPPVINDDGQIMLILEEPAASWTTASMIAKLINEAEGTAGERLAVAEDAKTVVVTIPQNERERPASFISRVLQLSPVPLQATEARVVLSEKKGSVIMTGDVEISPVLISYRGLTITTVTPPPVPSPRTPVTTEKNVVSLDTTSQGGAKLQELLDALNLINVPAEDKIAIVRELHRSGKLHAKLEEEH